MNCIDLTSKRSKMLSYVAKHSKPLNYKSDQIIMNCIDLTSKRSKMLSYVANHSKPLNYKSDQNNDLHRFWSKNVQNDQSNAKLQTRSNSDEFASIWSLDLMSKTSNQRKTTKDLFRWICIDLTSQNDQNNAKLRSDQIIMNCIDLTSKRSKELSYFPKLQKWSNYNALHRFDVKTI